MSAMDSQATPDTPEEMAARLFEVQQAIKELEQEKEFLNLQLNQAKALREVPKRFEHNGLRAVCVERAGSWHYSQKVLAAQLDLKEHKRQEQSDGTAIRGEITASWRVTALNDAA